MRSLWNIILSLSLLSCSCSTPAEGAKTENPEEHTVPIVSQEAQSIVNGNSLFAFDLYSKIRSHGGNLFFSPYSISSALAMAYAGAEGSTKQEMTRVLHYPGDDTNLQEGFALLNQILTSEDSKTILNTRVNIASSLWLQTGMKFLPSFQSTISKQYAAALQQVDFAKHPDVARGAINKWVTTATHGRIPDLLQPHDITTMTRLLLVNAIFMRGTWQNPFNLRETELEVFHMERGLTGHAVMMERVGQYAYLKEDTYAVVELPYKKNSNGMPDLAMLIALPNNIDELSNIEEILSPELLQEWMSKLSMEAVQVIIPKFKITETLSLKDVLQQMGMMAPFSDEADFSGITGSKDLAMSNVIHKAYIHVDEAGTEAAAATAVSMNTTAVMLPTSPYVFKADHPFLFAIIDKETKTLLFLGRLQQP